MSEQPQSQLSKFKQAAREIGADESDGALDRAMGKLDLRAKPAPTPEPKKPKGE